MTQTSHVVLPASARLVCGAVSRRYAYAQNGSQLETAAVNNMADK